MKVVIAGSRSFAEDYDFFKNLMNLFVIQMGHGLITEVVSGGAAGIDKLGEEWAKRSGLPIKQFLPDWETHGKLAGFVRNEDMAQYCDCGLIVWNGYSSGTKNMIEMLRKHRKSHYQLNWEYHKQF